MAQLATRNVITANTEILAEPLEGNFATIWSVINGHIGSDNIEPDAVSGANVGKNQIVGGASTSTSHLQQDTITQWNIAADAISTSELQVNAVETENLKDDAVTAAKVATNAITGDHINSSLFPAWFVATGAQKELTTTLSAVAEFNRTVGSPACAYNAVIMGTIQFRSVTNGKTFTVQIQRDGSSAKSFSVDGQGSMDGTLSFNAMTRVNKNDTGDIKVLVKSEDGSGYCVSGMSAMTIFCIPAGA